MAYQSQTYGNNNNGYYIQNQAVINPSSSVALLSPVEFLFNSTIQGPYFGSITQNISSLTLAENESAGLSTINALIMTPTVPVTQMFVSDKTNIADQPIIQQWANTSTIINGILKISNKNLNDEANAYNIINTSAVTVQRQGALTQTTSLADNTTRFDNNGNDPFTYVELNQTLQTPSVTVRNFGAFSKMNVSSIQLSVGTPGFGATDRLYLQYNPSPPYQGLIGSSQDLEIATNNGNTLNATFKTDGTTVFNSTIFATSVSTNTLNTVTVNSITTNASVLNTSTITANSGTINNLIGLSTINALPIVDYIGNPVGTIISWAGGDLNLLPPGYLLCDGSEVAQATYNRLFIIIGNTWGTASPGNFRLPDSRGKTLCGSIGINSPIPGINLGAPYTVTGTMIALTPVNIPAQLGGGTRVAMKVTGLSNQLYVGMRVLLDGNGYNYTTQIVAFVDFDGLWGNAFPGSGNTNNSGVVLFDTSQTANPVPPPTNLSITFTNADTDVKLYPFNGNTFNPTAAPRSGFGNYYNRQQIAEVSNHQHVVLNPGGKAVAGTQLFAGDFNIGANTSVNSGLYQYVSGNGTLLDTPGAMSNIPYNMATWQLIKF